jgi:hypothetical protein
MQHARAPGLWPDEARSLPVAGAAALPAVARQCARIETGIIKDASDLCERQAKFAVEKDVLKPQHLGLPVIAIAVLANVGRQQSDMIVMMQGTDADTRCFRHLLDRPHDHTSNCCAMRMRDDVASGSRAK